MLQNLNLGTISILDIVILEFIQEFSIVYVMEDFVYFFFWKVLQNLNLGQFPYMEMEANKAQQQLDSIFDDEGHFDNGTPIWNFEN